MGSRSQLEIVHLIKIVARNLVLLALLVLLGFVLPRMLPGSPLSFTADEISAENLGLPAASFNRFAEFYAPELPLAEQLTRYLRQVFSGSWGSSFYYGLPVTRLIFSKLPWTLFLSLTALSCSTIGGIALGFHMADDNDARGTGWKLPCLVMLQALPGFLLAILLQLLFSRVLGWLPSEGAYPPGTSKGTVFYWWQVLRHACLPLLVLTLTRLPGIAILTRNVVLRIQNEPYVEAARYRGVPEQIIRRQYVLLNSWPELLGRLSIQFLYAIAGALLVEMVFSYPGLGLLMRNAVSARDYPLIQGIFLVTSIYSVLVNLCFELLTRRMTARYQG